MKKFFHGWKGCIRMLFNSYEFMFLFMPITLLGLYSLNKLCSTKIRIAWLVIMSLIFYSWWNPAFLFLLGGSICFNYVIGFLLAENQNKQKRLIKSIYILWFGIGIDLLVLIYYKYFGFLLDSLNVFFAAGFSTGNIILPIGISFFTFTQIAFLVDVYRGNVKEYHFLSYILFVTFFPHLIAGPILHHKEMMPQFEDENTLPFSWSNFTVGTTVFIWGLFKKVVIADSLAKFATPVFEVAAHGQMLFLGEAWIGALAYTLQLYYDFSGYSEMAMGLAFMCNIRLPVNFMSPYKAVSIIEFWRRWHMTLSRYLKDYLYIPLGGNRQGEAKKFRNLMITMLLGGLWHGAGWTFIIWGALHGVFLVINHLWKKTNISLPNIICWLMTFLCITVAWVFFRADTLHTAVIIVKGMFGVNGIVLPTEILNKVPYMKNYILESTILMTESTLSAKEALPWIAISFFAVFVPNIIQMTQKYNSGLFNKNQRTLLSVSKLCWRPSCFWGIAFGLMATISLLFMSHVSEFLYFQF